MSIQLTHPRIINFFELNKHINPEDIQLQMIDLLEKNAVLHKAGFPHAVNNIFQINELRIALSRFNETISAINKQIMDMFVTVKTQYVLEYNSINESDNQRQCILNNHHQFTAKMQSAIFSIIHEPILKSKYPSLHEKIQQLTRQFIRIMENNMLTSMSAPTKYRQEYLANFETNAAHMVQSMQTIFTDFATSKESACNTIIASLSVGGEGSLVSSSRIQYELTDFTKIASTTGNSFNASSFEQVIHKAFPTASNIYTEDCTSDNRSSIVICRYGVPDIRVSSYTHKDRNVNADEIREDLKICQQTESNGIIVSQNTGISGKPNYHIDIQNHHAIIYIHCAQNTADKIQLAVDMIDSIYQKLSEIKISPEYRESIPKETLDDINREYQQFIVQKETFAQLVKDTHRKMTAQLDDLRFPSLDRFLGTRYSSCKKQGYTCDLCGSFNVATLKGLAAHKRGCQRKLGTPCNANTVK